MEMAKLPRLPYRLMAVALINGAVIMIVELTGSRIIAPYFGSSLYVWTSIIGCILVALSVGYWYGGRLADRQPRESVLAGILLTGALFLLGSRLLQDAIMGSVSAVSPGVLLGSIMVTLLLFVPTTFILGMVSPFVAKLTLIDKKHAGESVGLVFSAGTVGSIVGTFLTGYVLFQYLGNARIILICVMILTGAGMLLKYRKLLPYQIVLLVIVAVLVARSSVFAYPTKGLVLDRDSAYNRIIVSDVQQRGRTLRMLQTDALGAQSGIYLGSDDLPFNYTRAFLDVAKLSQDGRTLLIGGGAFTVPRELARISPQRRVDTVEIDPALVQVAKDYFDYRPPVSHQVIHEDARAYLNNNKQQYDLILVDAFQSLTPPFQLTTHEAISKIQKSLSTDGVLAMNLISRPDWQDSFLATQYATVRQSFRNIRVYQYKSSGGSSRSQNIFLIASNSELPSSPSLELDREIVFSEDGLLSPVLTDDFAPVEALTQ